MRLEGEKQREEPCNNVPGVRWWCSSVMGKGEESLRKRVEPGMRQRFLPGGLS